jgi:hypothetical protein
MNEQYLIKWVQENSQNGKVDAEKLIEQIKNVEKYNFQLKKVLCLDRTKTK